MPSINLFYYLPPTRDTAIRLRCVNNNPNSVLFGKYRLEKFSP